MSSGFPPPSAGTLQYAGIDMKRRPALVTALGICSIIFGVLGLLFNLAYVARNSLELLRSPLVSSGSIPGTTADTTPAGQLTPAEAVQIVDGLVVHQALTEDEAQRLVHALQHAESPLAPSRLGWTPWHINRLLNGSATYEPGDPYGGATEDAASPHGEGEAPEEVWEERAIHFDFGGNGDIWIMEDRIELYALPLEGGEVETTVWADGRIDIVDNREPGSAGQLLLGVATSLAAVGLALMLLVAGIQTLRDRLSAGRLHRTWAWLRIALSVVVLGVAAWVMAQEWEALSVAFGALAWVVVGAGLLLQILLTAAYPVAVLIVLRTGRVRAWFSGSKPAPPVPAGPTSQAQWT